MQLRPYQQEVAKAVLESIQDNLGLTFSVEIARQGGKNELSAHLEVLLLTMHMAAGGSSIKCSPTFKPQTIISINRLKERLNDFGFAGLWGTEAGYILRLGNARQIFLSADESAAVVGHTADILLEIDESQDVARDKYTKEFRPMASASNATTVHYGTTWDDATLLEEIKQANLELERKDGIRRHFRYDWLEISKHNPHYQAFVEAERQRLGEDHPLFRTQYALLPIRGGGGFLTSQQIARMMGNHSRLHHPQQTGIFVAGIDFAGESEQLEDEVLIRPGRDATVITIAQVTPPEANSPYPEPLINILEHYSWLGQNHASLHPQMVDILKNVWNCRYVVADATGIGEPITSFLRRSLGNKIVPFKFTQKSKSELGFDLLAAVNSGRLKLYLQDGSEEYRQVLSELERARSTYRPNQTLNFFVDAADGHDDYLMSLALVVHAANRCQPRVAKGQSRNS
ncbi:MAG: hypothetical protein FJ008_01445 [Chloroflexi bacterium]|nr:hypothetical protein [Chloroflexota bacterium]MBM3173671.1 hypothetical protein [Chloroflexota bacterium]MBM3174279.1 hypothetical protein [Chloroflexota bacterium]MBM4449628.1 hypothetical protein [Chloroflexota bacterium]